MVIDKTLKLGATVVLNISGVFSREWRSAIKEVAAGLSNTHPGSSAAYAVIVDQNQFADGTPNYLASAKQFAQAYVRLFENISRIKRETLISENSKGLLRNLSSGESIRVFNAKGIREQVKPSPGVYIIPYHLDAGFLAHLDLPQFPRSLRDLRWVIQVENTGILDKPESISLNLDSTLQPPDSAVGVEAAIKRDTLEWRKQFVVEYPTWTSAQVAEQSNSRAKNRPSTASRWVKERRLFAVLCEGQKRFPEFQFQDGRPIRAVAQVISIFPEHATGWQLAYFFTTPNVYISNRKPFELLKTDPSRVVSLARAFVHPADVF